MDLERLDPVTVPCLECGVELAGDSPELRLELTCDDEPLVYCAECWEREGRRWSAVLINAREPTRC